MLRVLELLGTDGKHAGRAVLPDGWVREMTRPSRVSAETGMQVARLKFGDDEALGITGVDGSAYWLIPRRELAILNIANPGGGSLPELPALLLKGLPDEPR